MTGEMRALLELAGSGDRKAEARLIEDNSGLIWSIARRYYGRGVEPDDLYQLACVGFIKAVRGFNAARGNEFSTYAVPKIAGEIRRFLRDDGAVKVSRAVKERAVRVRRIQSDWESRHGRSPTVSELAEAAGLTAEEVAACEQADVSVDSFERELSGGGRLGEALAELLCEAGVRVKLIEQNPERCRELAERLPEVSVLCADGTRQDFLFSENISQMDAVVALTNLDEENVFICMYARMQGVPQAIPKVNRTEYAAVCQNCGIRGTVSPKDICAQEITRYVRAMESTDGESVLSVYSLLGGRVEALEFLVTADVPHLGESLASVTLQQGILLACISRGAKVLFPGGGDSLQQGDTVIVIAPRERHIAELRQIFAERG